MFLMNVYLAVLIYMYDPSGMGAFNDIVSFLPNRLVVFLDLATIDSSMTGFLGGLFYGLPIYVFPMIYCIVMGNRLVTKYIYDGSFACFLETPNSRIKIITTLFTQMNVGAAFMTTAIAMINFFFGCIFNDSKLTMFFSTAFPVLFFMLTFLSGLSDRFAALKNFSIYSVYNGAAIGIGQADVSSVIAFFSAAIVLSLAASLGVFFMKRLPI
jgi:ABC-2 type transport system permease protein